MVIVGCGQIGASLATRLGTDGDEVTVVDVDDTARERLVRGQRHTFVHGDAVHRAVLQRAGIEEADGLVALTGSDTTNIVVARTARDVYRVPHVAGLLHEPGHAPLCTGLGLPMITPSRMAVDRVRRVLRHARLEPVQVFGDGDTVLVRSMLPAYLGGRPVSELNVPGEIQVVEVSRGGRSAIPGSGSTLQLGDTVTFVAASGSLGRLRTFLGRGTP